MRWGTGIASRGRFTGADKPLEESVPVRPKGRRRDLDKRQPKQDDPLASAYQHEHKRTSEPASSSVRGDEEPGYAQERTNQVVVGT